ncbi:MULTISPECIES: hypothetical protein [Fischerella]|nr:MULTISPECIES: hypothetical protein [Fischerella]
MKDSIPLCFDLLPTSTESFDERSLDNYSLMVDGGAIPLKQLQ